MIGYHVKTVNYKLYNLLLLDFYSHGNYFLEVEFIFIEVSAWNDQINCSASETIHSDWGEAKYFFFLRRSQKKILLSVIIY